MRQAVNIIYRWVLGAKETAQKFAARSLDKLHIGTPRQTEASTPGNASGIPAAGVAWPVDPESHDGVSFVAADCFYAHYDAKKREVYMLDDIKGDRHKGARPLRVGVNVEIVGSKKRSGRGTVIRTAEYGTQGLYKNIFRHDTADLIAHHVQPDPPENSSIVYDPDGDSERAGGLHYPLRVREWVRVFCQKYFDRAGKLFAPLFNLGRNGDGTPAYGAAHWDRDEGVLSDEAGGPLATADDGFHVLAVTSEANINQGGNAINTLYGPVGGLYMPEEIILAQWEPGSKGPFVMRVEKRPDYNAKHKNHCGMDALGVIKWQSWDMFREYPPTIKEPPPPDTPPPPPVDDPPGEPGDPGTPDGGKKKKPGNPITGEGQTDKERKRREDEERRKRGEIKQSFPVCSVPPEGIPPTAATPNETESPSHYGHPAPAVPDGEPSRNTDDPGTNAPEAPNDPFWDNRYGFTERAWNEFSNVCSHEFSLPVYASSSRGTGPNPWPTVNRHREGLLQFDAQGNIVGRDANIGDGTVIDAPAWSKPWHALSALHGSDWLESQHARVVLAGKNSDGVTIDGRFGIGARGLTSPFTVSGMEVSLDFTGDGTITTPDTRIDAKTAAGAADALGLAKLIVGPRLKTEAGRVRKVTATGGDLTLDNSHHFVHVTGAHTITLPASPAIGTEYEVENGHGSAITIRRNGLTINGASSDFTLDPATRAFIQTNADASGWRLKIAGESAGGGSGDVVGPSSATDNAIARFDTTTGKLIQNSGVIVDDADMTTIRVHADGAKALLITPDSALTGNTNDITIDAGAGPGSTANFGTASAEATFIGRAGKTATINGNFALPDDDVQVSEGGTGASTAPQGLSNLGGYGTPIALAQMAMM